MTDVVATEALTEDERMVLLAARELRDGETCFVGVGVPSLAAMLAKRTHAPDLVLIYESGAIDADPPQPPLSTGSPSIVANTSMLGSCLDVFASLQSGDMDCGLLSGAQVDRYGNLNSTVIGDYAAPRLRMVGSGGAHDITTLAKRYVIVMPHDPRRIVERVDFVTSPGLIGPGNEREKLGLPGGGPECLVTPRARFSFEAGELTLNGQCPGVAEDEAVEGFSWEVPRAGTICELLPFDEDAIRELRETIMPPD